MPQQNANAYAVLASIYDDAGFSNYSTHVTPELLTFMQQKGWLGKRILDLGSGTGTSSSFFSQRMMDVTAIDASPEMQQIAHKRVEGTGYLVDFIVGDVTEMDLPGAMDLVYSIGGLVNELDSLQAAGQLFQKIFKSLEPDRWFVFDMLTLRGLGEYLGNTEQILDISDRLFITVQNLFDYDTMTLRQFMICYLGSPAQTWTRHNIMLRMRGFPHAAVLKLLEKVGFEIVGSYTTDMQVFDPNNDTEGRVIVMAKKPAV